MFSDILNNYFNELGFSAAELSKASGVSASAISRYKNAENDMQLSTKRMTEIAKGISMLSKGKYTEDEVLESFGDASKENDISSIVEKLNLLIDSFDINVAALAKSMNYDPSYISHIRTGRRVPSDIERFTGGISEYVFEKYAEEQPEIISSLTGVKDENLSVTNIKNWLCRDSCSTKPDITNFLAEINDFNLEKYIKAIKFDKIRVPSAPFTFTKSKYYTGIEGLRKGELDFFKQTILSKSGDDVFMYNEMPMTEMSRDKDFDKKWMMAIAVLLKKGLHLNIIHNLDRPMNELLLGLEAWIPIYMTGQISPYYMKNRSTPLFRHILYCSGSVSLSGSCVKRKHSNAYYYLAVKKDELEIHKKQTGDLLKIASPLMEIYTKDRLEELTRYIKKESTEAVGDCFTLDEAEKTFRNIKIVVRKKTWAAVIKSDSPNIGFLIRHPQLISAIECFTPLVKEK